VSEVGTEEPGPTDARPGGATGPTSGGGFGGGGLGGADRGFGSARDEGLGSAREEAERLVAAGLGAVSTALQGMEARRQLRGLAEQLLGSEQAQDLAAGLNGFVSGVTGGVAPGPRSAPGADRNGADGNGADGNGAGAARNGGADGHGGGSHDHETDHETEHETGSPVAHGPRFSTGSADCCICPVCRVIAALRDPSPELAERLATAVGDLAVGLAGVLRAFSAPASGGHPSGGHLSDEEPSDEEPSGGPASGERPAGERPADQADPGRAATVPPPRTRPDPADSEILEDPTSHTMSDLPRSPKMAKKAVKKAVRKPMDRA
jgi:hypothetical protein